MNWIKAAWDWARKLPVGRLLKPLWKPILVEAIRRERETLSLYLKAAIEEHGVVAIDRAFDALQLRLERKVSQLRFLPAAWLEPVNRAIEENGDEWQAKAKEAVIKGGPSAINLVLSQAEFALVERIEAL